MPRISRFTFLTLLLLAFGGPAPAVTGNGEWPAYGRTPGGLRHSPLEQIRTSNVKELHQAWTYRTGELARYSGELLWQTRLPAAAHSVPMTYEVNGKQYLVVTAGGHGKIDPSKLGDYVIAFAVGGS